MPLKTQMTQYSRFSSVRMGFSSSEEDDWETGDQKIPKKETKLQRLCNILRSICLEIRYLWALIPKDPRKWYMFWAKRRDYMDTDVVVVLRRTVSKDDFEEAYNLVAKTWLCVSAYFGHKSTELYFNRNTTWIDKSNAARHRKRSCSRIMLVSKWDSRWQFQKRSLEWKTEKEKIKPFLLEADDVTIHKELSRIEPKLKNTMKAHRIQQKLNGNSFDGKRRKWYKCTGTRFCVFVFSVILLPVFYLGLRLLYVTSQHINAGVFYAQQNPYRGIDSLVNQVYTPTWYSDHWYNSWDADNPKHQTPSVLKATPISKNPIFMKPLEVINIDRIKRETMALDAT